VTDPLSEYPELISGVSLRGPDPLTSLWKTDSPLEMNAAITRAAIEQCWRRIGVTGDRTCPKLEVYIHCRNCPVIAEAARGFFDREAPDGYVASWERLLEQPEQKSETDALTVLIFRVGTEWLALPIGVLVEVTSLRTLHRIPHREGTVLEGLVNVRGQLQVCVSLHRLLGVNAAVTDIKPLPDRISDDLREHGAITKRLLVVEHQGLRRDDRWVFGVDEVAGVQNVEQSAMRTTPSTVNQSSARFCRMLFKADDKTVGMLDDARIFEGLRTLITS
jgi:chemotaxis-related protein WspD